jgi:small subunit ribosomal protein S16
VVTIRLSRGGSKKTPFYRLMVTDSRSPRDGKFLENVGTYNPRKGEGGELFIKRDRVEYWTKVGAKPSATVAALLKRKA